VLVSRDGNKFVAKISDFGLSRSSGHHTDSSDVIIPVRWSAPEVLKKLKYSFKSDVWSFGVSNSSSLLLFCFQFIHCMTALWELLEGGSKPYSSCGCNREAGEEIIKGSM
jgi:serine/threonine protein kinase